MAADALAQKSRTGLIDRIRSLRKSAANIREAAEASVRRIGIAAASGGTAYGVGRLTGWAERDGKDIMIPNTEVPWHLAAGIAATAVGAIGTKMLGETLADVTLGVGTGAISGHAGIVGYKTGLKPPS